MQPEVGPAAPRLTPRAETCRLLLDRRHRSCALVSGQTGAVLGGITYRVFGQQVSLAHKHMSQMGCPKNMSYHLSTQRVTFAPCCSHT
jgi:hypothetical protein